MLNFIQFGWNSDRWNSRRILSSVFEVSSYFSLFIYILLKSFSHSCLETPIFPITFFLSVQFQLHFILFESGALLGRNLRIFNLMLPIYYLTRFLLSNNLIFSFCYPSSSNQVFLTHNNEINVYVTRTSDFILPRSITYRKRVNKRSLKIICLLILGLWI